LSFRSSPTRRGFGPGSDAHSLRVNNLYDFLSFLLFQNEANTVHPLFTKADRLSAEVIGAAIEVHRIMGRETVSQGLSCRAQTRLNRRKQR
jgi:hypothetical protein